MNYYQNSPLKIYCIFFLGSLIFSGCCSHPDFESLPDLMYDEVTASAFPDQNGNINLDAGDTLEILSDVTNMPGNAKCNPLDAASSLMNAVVTIMDDAGNPIGTADTLYNVAGLTPDEIVEVLSGIIFLTDGDYTLDFGLDYNNGVKERDENNNLIDVFNVLYQIAMILFNGKNSEPIDFTPQQIIDFAHQPLPRQIKVHTGSGKADPALIKHALETNDFSAFVKFY